MIRLFDGSMIRKHLYLIEPSNHRNAMRSPLLTVMTNAAIAAGKGLLRDFGEVDQLQVSRKGTHDFVTKSDVRTEKKLVAELQKARPDFGFLLEEGGEIKGKDPTHRWIIDPIDGTSNFIHAHPYFCISIALEKRTGNKSEIIASVIYDALHNEMFTAEQYKGAFLNERRLNVSKRDNLDEAMLSCGSPNRNAQSLQRYINVANQTANIRITGAAALDLAYIAAGRLEGCWYGALKPWDIAAGMLLVQEAGGMITDFSGQSVNLERGAVLATNGAVHSLMLKLLAG